MNTDDGGKNGDATQRARTASDAFRRAFDRAPAFGVRAPGRVNLIGEHTDYNEGLVMPCAIDLDTAMWVAPRSDTRVRVRSLELDAAAEFDIETVLGTTKDRKASTGERSVSARSHELSTRTGTWIDYVAGPVFALGALDERTEASREAGRLRGFDAIVSSRVPIGAGLSSSAALGLAAAFALARSNELTLSHRELAELAWCGERDYVGTGCGVLDFYASALGSRDAALRIDCRDLSVREIPMPAGVELLIAHSGVSRTLATSHYSVRLAECGQALEQAIRAGLAAEGTPSLRAFGPTDLGDLEQHLGDVPFRRARHVIEENERVDRFAAAIAGDRYAEAGALLRAGMDSLRTNYEASAPELDFLCACADEFDGCFGSRLTGAGWGGCTIHLVETGAGPEVAAHLGARFGERFGRVPPTWSVRASQGAGAWLPGVSDARRR